MRPGLALAILLGTISAAFAEGYDIVVPIRPDVPIVINGIDVNYAVLEGEFGLGKGVNNQPTIYGGRLAPPEPPVGHYYPTLGLKPATGRLEIEPPANRKLPQPAESYHQSWGAQSMPVPATVPNAQPEVPFYPPPVIVAPREGNETRRNDSSGPPQDFRRKPERLPN
jgi:hypothetical protein